MNKYTTDIIASCLAHGHLNRLFIHSFLHTTLVYIFFSIIYFTGYPLTVTRLGRQPDHSLAVND